MKSPEVYSKYIQSSIGNVGDLVEEILNCVVTVCTDADACAVFELKVILNEILVNAIKHGNMGNANKKIRVEAYFTRQNVVNISVMDEGRGYDFFKISDCQRPYCEEDDIYSIDECGRGIMILKSLCDNIETNRKGNKIIVSKNMTRI